MSGFHTFVCEYSVNIRRLLRRVDGHPASDAPQLFAARYSTHPQRTPQAPPPSASEPVVSVVCAHRDNITRWQLQLAVDNVKAFSKSTENEAVLAECIGGA